MLNNRMAWTFAPALLMVVAGCSEQVPESTVDADLVPLATKIGLHGQAQPTLVEGCNLETIDGKAVTSAALLASSKDVLLSGWIAGQISAEGALEGSVIVRVARQESEEALSDVSASPDGRRDDVAGALGWPALVNSGFKAELEAQDLAAGNYTLTLLRGGYQCGQSFTVRRG